MKTYCIGLSEKVTVVVNVRKPLFGKHPQVSSVLFYDGSQLCSRQETSFQGLVYDNYQDYDALLEAMVLLGKGFREYDFLFVEFPGIKEYDCSFVYKRYGEAAFPLGSIFEVKDLIIDRGGDVYYLLKNSNLS